MPRSQVFGLWLIILAVALSAGAQSPSTATPTPTNTPTPTPPKRASEKPGKGMNNSQPLYIHKPKPSPSWGKVIQYRREEILALSENNRETLHEFLFQDDDGVVRTATFHEGASGDGYWEVWVWDQP